MRGLRRTEKFKTDKPSNRNLKRKPRGAVESRKEDGRGAEVATVRRDSGRKKELQEAEYRNRKEGMETGLTEEESMHRRNRCQGRTGRREKKEQKAE